MESALLAWYGQNGRDLPWRKTRDPYAILVSEVMAQQTQVERVIPRWQRWLARWPTVDALAAAAAADVIREWQGLGYNRRAVALHRAAQHVAAHGWPDDLTELPGVGRYTADAVACFAFGRPVLPVDVNVRRISGRTHRSFSPPAPQALMDLASLGPAAAPPARVPRLGGPVEVAPSRSVARGRSRARSGSGGRLRSARCSTGASRTTPRPSPRSRATGSCGWTERPCRSRTSGV